MIADQYSRTTAKSHIPEQRFANGQEGATSSLGGVKLLLKQVRDLREYFSHFVAAKADGMKLSLRSTVLRLVLAGLGFVVLSGFLVIGGWFAINGVAGGLSVLFGDRLWLGNLAAGVLSLTGLGLGMYFAAAKSRRTFLETTVTKYETRQQNSVATRPTGQHVPPPKKSERGSLANQAADAKTAMIRTLYEMKATLGKATDLRPYIRPHPRLLGVTALAVGFVAGAVMGLARRRRATTPNVGAQGNGRAAYADPERKKAAPRESFLFATAGSLLVGIVQAVVKNSLAASASPTVPRRDQGLSRDDSTGS